MAGPGEEPGAPLFLDQNEAQRAENFFFFETEPPPLSQSLDDPPPHMKVWIRHCLVAACLYVVAFGWNKTHIL